MGVNHCNEYNPFNLTCDLMEPFRPVVDREVYKCRSFAFDDFFKSRLIDILNHKVIILSKEQFLSNAINIYVKLFFRAMDPALGSGGMTPLRGPGAPPAPGAPLRTDQHRVQSST